MTTQPKMATFESSVEENETRYSCQHHARKLLVNLNETRKNPDLCDAYVSVDGLKISVQKSVLSAASQYLRYCTLFFPLDLDLPDFDELRWQHPILVQTPKPQDSLQLATFS